MKKILLFVCLTLCWISVCCQNEEPQEQGDRDQGNHKIVPIPDQSQIQLKDKFCFSYGCLANLTDPLEGDKQCRLFAAVNRNRWCYCCGGLKEYHTFGTVCRRYCIQNKIGNDFYGPCRPNQKTEKENNQKLFSPDRPFPDIPSLVSEADLICDKEADVAVPTNEPPRNTDFEGQPPSKNELDGQPSTNSDSRGHPLRNSDFQDPDRDSSSTDSPNYHEETTTAFGSRFSPTTEDAKTYNTTDDILSSSSQTTPKWNRNQSAKDKNTNEPTGPQRRRVHEQLQEDHLEPVENNNGPNKGHDQFPSIWNPANQGFNEDEKNYNKPVNFPGGNSGN